jgi:SAM-dependent methyltransferase
VNSSDTYILGRTDRETRRLILQHLVFGPLTRRFFQAAGIGAGMKVLDIGSGAGDVSILTAELVGLTGRVVGVDMNAEILETARARAEAAGWSNLTFLAGDVRELELDDDFDAVVGRWILMHVPEPASLIRHLVTRLKPGGIVAFHENDFTYPPTTFPLTSFSQEANSWAVPPVDDAMRRWESVPRRPGPEPQMGTKLYKTYVEVRLPDRSSCWKPRSVEGPTGRVTNCSRRRFGACCRPWRKWAGSTRPKHSSTRLRPACGRRSWTSRAST